MLRQVNGMTGKWYLQGQEGMWLDEAWPMQILGTAEAAGK